MHISSLVSRHIVHDLTRGAHLLNPDLGINISSIIPNTIIYSRMKRDENTKCKLNVEMVKQ